MMMLDDFERALDREIKYRQNEGDSVSRDDDDMIVDQFQKAARQLIEKQVLHADDRMKSVYRLICRHEPYFDRLMHGLGYVLLIDSIYEYIIVMPGNIDGATRRGKLKKDESLLLLTLRIMWEESSRDGEMDDLGRIFIDTDALLDRLTALGGGDTPSKSRLKEMLDLWRANGFVRVGEEDREEEIIPVTIMPAIKHLVTPDLVKEIEAFLDAEDPESDVFANIEKNRVEAEEAARQQALDASRKEDAEETNFFDSLHADVTEKEDLKDPVTSNSKVAEELPDV
ncbi:DUF4194 domain-containing protein [Ruegeria sp. HKCCE4150]|uniref:DUF4194 domain-containing protein n=1 Tax=Ruegeria sp. HKCCE4150 TaxID=2794828 RepID=UPI001AEB62B4|nr:DUF4194 domain-containing protein [Ruegeria sp. HKCCE4150]